MITVFSNNKEIPTNKVEFSDGAITFRLSDLPEDPRYISINVSPTTPVKDVREEVDMVVSCIENFYGVIGLDELRYPVYLNLPYLPYGRADRVFEVGNASPLHDFLTWRLLKRFTEVNVCDAHNPKALAGFNVENKSQLDCFKQSIPYDFNEDYDFIVAPDKGAIDKALTIAEHLETDIIYAGKERDMSTGRITKTTLPEHLDLNGAKVLIPDDLCDGAGTFIFLAKALRERGAKEIHLYVTHGIFSKGLKVLDGVIDKVYCYQTVSNYVNKRDVFNFNLGKI